MIRAGLALATLALAACSEAPAVVPRPEPASIGATVLPSEAELLERARAEIAPEEFDAELKRLRREILGPDVKAGRQ